MPPQCRSEQERLPAVPLAEQCERVLRPIDLSPVLWAGFLFQLSSLPDLIPALTAAEQRAAASLKWRTHEKLLQKYACLPHVISSDQIYYRFLQRMFTIMMTNVSPIPFILFFRTRTRSGFWN